MDSNDNNTFLPCLLRVEVSADYISPRDILWITAWWENRGQTPALEPLRCFLELEFGHQRLLETEERFHRRIWEPEPGAEYWYPGDVVATTCRYRLPPMWGGTYRLYLGLCDEDSLPIGLLGVGGRPARRVYVGDVELGWGWGMALLELIRKPWSRELNPAAAGAPREPRSRPAPVQLDGEVRVTVDAAGPQILGLDDGRTRLSFEPLGIVVLMRDLARDQVHYSYQPAMRLECRGERSATGGMVYDIAVRHEGAVCARLAMALEIAARRLTIRMLESSESEGWELLELRMPSLAALAGDGVHLVDFHAGGRLIGLGEARPMGYVHPYDTRNAVAMYDDHRLFALESHSLDDKLYVIVEERNGAKRAMVGASITHRIRAHGTTRSIRGPNSHRIDIDVLAVQPDGPPWLQFAKHLRRGLRRGAGHDLYRRAIHTAYYASQGPAPRSWQVNEDSPYPIARLNKGLRFPQILDSIIACSSIFDGAPQIAWIYGYNRQNDEDGGTVSFPWAYEADPRGGTVAELRSAIAEAARHNASLGLYENYDDFYRSRYTEADMRYVAQDAYGKPFRGWIWADGPSFILGHRKYVEQGAMRERVRRMFDVYGPRRTGYIDVLSSEVLRYDFDPACPATPEECLRSRLAIIEEHNRYGMDVSSETLVQPYVGHMGYAHSTRLSMDDCLFSGDTWIPLLAAVYHGTIGYGGGGSTRGEMLRALIHAGTYGFETGGHPTAEQVKWVYLQGMPLGLLYDESMESCTEERGVYEIGYTSDCRIRVDLHGYRYEVVAHGRLVAKDWTTFVPGFTPGTYLAYALNGGTIRYPRPQGWDSGAEARAVQLTFAGEGTAVPCRLGGDSIEIDMPAGTPVRISDRHAGGLARSP